MAGSLASHEIWELRVPFIPRDVSLPAWTPSPRLVEEPQEGGQVSGDFITVAS